MHLLQVVLFLVTLFLSVGGQEFGGLAVIVLLQWVGVATYIYSICTYVYRHIYHYTTVHTCVCLYIYVCVYEYMC